MQYLTDTDLAGERGCILSDCGTYRLSLWREWDKSLPRVAALMLNPSTASHLVTDPTDTRIFTRAVAMGFGRYEIVNLFPLRSTDPDVLLTHPDPIGPRRGGISADGAILDAVSAASMVWCAWGAHPAAAARAAEVMDLIRMTGMRNKLYHLGLNKDGSPKHPLYIAASTRPKLFTYEATQ
ncbi:DUF1643 domain-containing protein [Paraburkholderia caribensis]|uniref:DUF1643 domain-containing protein n=1 Tax=Paraburkholderia caribensis TaxID=75105 RepID=UPI002854A6A7|nr:DUF1643 domain-containing protein [Paraburkholderia caribensis]MDR6381773.1 hypothetical protein [Paraburkholderia caribensis]